MRDDAAPARPDGQAARFQLRHIVIAGCALFLASDLLFCQSLRPAPALLVAFGCILGLWSVLRETGRVSFLHSPVDARLLSFCLALAFVVFLLGGQGHIFYANDDWLLRDAVLADMAGGPPPLSYAYDGASWMLRAPLGMYLAPAAIGRLVGLEAAHGAMFVQNTLLLGFSLYLLAACAPRAPVVLVAIVMIFSGLDVIGEILRDGLAALPMHLEAWNPLFQYSSSITQMFWVPNHALPAWWSVGLLMLSVRGAFLPATGIAMFAALLIWSPLTMIGVAPLLAALALRNWRALLTAQTAAAIAAGLCFIPVALYLTSDAARIPSHWLVQTRGFFLFYSTFILIEIPQALLPLALPRFWREPWRTPLMVSLAVLFAIPFYGLGEANDFSMRTSIASLLVLACCFAVAATDAVLSRRWVLSGLAAILILVGAATPAVEIVRALVFPRFAISRCDLITSWRETTPQFFIGHYLARSDAMPDWLMEKSTDETPRFARGSTCWPDHPAKEKPILWRNYPSLWTLFQR